MLTEEQQNKVKQLRTELGDVKVNITDAVSVHLPSLFLRLTC